MAAPLSPAPYRHWQQQTRRLLEPLAALMRPGAAHLPIAGRASDHGVQADRLECFVRPLVVAAHYLQSAPGDDDAAFRASIARWFRTGLVLGSDPASPVYWGPDAAYHQHHVEMGLLVIALQIAPSQLWEPLSPAEQAVVARWLGTSRGSGIVNNNHLFMSVHILEFLVKYGYARRTDRAVIDAHFRQLETMHRRGGWFEDGINQAFDHYNAYAFHFYALWWIRLHGARDEARAQRWRDWAGLFVRDYQHFFAASGEHPAFGRSITYRFNASNVFALAVAAGATDLPLGRLRRLCTRNLDFFLSQPIQQAQGCLAVGWTDAFDALAEDYSCSASPYWCAKGLAALTLPPEHPFWHEPEAPLPAELGDFARPIPTAGLLVRGVGGEVEILNAGSMIGHTQLRYGAWKWSKLAYRTGVSFTLAKQPDFARDWSWDSALTQQLDDGRVFGRHSTVCTEMDEQHVGYIYGLGSKVGQINTRVETCVWWQAGWLLHVHLLDASQPVRYRLGGYALPIFSRADAGKIARRDLPGVNPAAPILAAFAPDGRGTVLQSLHGLAQTEWDDRTDAETPRRHIQAPWHVCPVLRTARTSGPSLLAALSWTGRGQEEARPWRLISGAAGRWQLEHPALGRWDIAHAALPAIS